MLVTRVTINNLNTIYEIQVSHLFLVKKWYIMADCWSDRNRHSLKPAQTAQSDAINPTAADPADTFVSTYALIAIPNWVSLYRNVFVPFPQNTTASAPYEAPEACLLSH